MADLTNKADNEPKTTDEPIISDIPVEDTDEPIISDLPQEITESYGTGVQEQPGLNIGGRTMREDMREYNAVGPELSGGDIDAAWDQAEGAAEETVGGTAPTPDQDIVDEVAAAVGIEMPDKAFLRTNEILEERDDRRWELDPKSSEDYQERKD